MLFLSCGELAGSEYLRTICFSLKTDIMKKHTRKPRTIPMTMMTWRGKGSRKEQEGNKPSFSY